MSDEQFYGWPLPTGDSGPAVEEVRKQTDDLYAAAGIDAAPESIRILLVDDRWEVRVFSPTRGIVTIGELNYFPVARVFLGELDAKRAAPNVARSARSEAKRADAIALHGAGRSVAYIARTIGRSRKQVARYLGGQKSGHDAKGASSPE